MLGGGGVLYALDSRGRKALLLGLKAARGGGAGASGTVFVAHRSGAWLWVIPPSQLSDGGALSGVFASISRMMGIPFVRIRAAIPEELFRGSLVEAIGRTHPLSAAAMRAHMPEQMQRLRTLLRIRGRVDAPYQRGQLATRGYGGKAGAGDSPERRYSRASSVRSGAGSVLSWLSGSSALTGPLRIGRTVDKRQQLARRNAAANAAALALGNGGAAKATSAKRAEMLLGGGGEASVRAPPRRRPRGVDDPDRSATNDVELFVGTALVYAFIYTGKLMPFDETAYRQMKAAHFFRHITVNSHDFDSLVLKFKTLIQQTGIGRADWWDCSRLWRIFLLSDERGFWEPSDGLAIALQAVPGVSPLDIAQRPISRWLPFLKREEYVREGAGGRGGSGTGRYAGSVAALRADTDPLLASCPFTEPSAAGILYTVPVELREIAAADASGLVHAERVWATMLAMAHLRSGSEHFLAEEPAALDDTGFTLLDGGQDYVARLFDACPALFAQYKGLKEKAEAQVKVWSLRHEAVLERLRREDQRQNGFAWLRRDHYTWSRVFSALTAGHETLSVVLGAADEQLPKHQRFAVLVTALLTMLCVQLWCAARPASTAGAGAAFPRAPLAPLFRAACVPAARASLTAVPLCLNPKPGSSTPGA